MSPCGKAAMFNIYINQSSQTYSVEVGLLSLSKYYFVQLSDTEGQRTGYIVHRLS